MPSMLAESRVAGGETPATVSAPYAFLSYASADRAGVLALAERLAAAGVPLWLDQQSIPGGADWDAEIVRGIKGCAALIVACTPAAMASGHVGQELRLALQYDRPILPLLLEPSTYPEAVEYVLAGRQRVEILERPETVWLPDVLTALARLGVAVAAPTPDLPVAPSTSLRPALTSFVGRQHKGEAIRRLLAAGRLVTLSGAGGVGKTRLAQEAASALLGDYPDGVWLVELAALADPALVPHAVAQVLGVRETSERTVEETLSGVLAAKALLLILDKCEHLLDGVAPFAEALLRAAPGLRVLATSREALRVAGEVVYRVPSLALPEAGPTTASGGTVAPLASLLESGAVRLFVERAAAARPGFALTEANAAAVVEICIRLDGMPLALQLAAARLSLLTPEQIAARLGDRFKLLTGGSRTALPRQQTLRAAIEWSYDLLDADERALLRRLAVFAGGWTLETAEAVCGGNAAFGILGSALRPATSNAEPRIPNAALTDLDVLDLLVRLVEKSLVVGEERGGDTRYRLLETVREFALERHGVATFIRADQEQVAVTGAEVQTALGEAAFEAAWSAGRALPLDAAPKEARAVAEADGLTASAEKLGEP